MGRSPLHLVLRFLQVAQADEILLLLAYGPPSFVMKRMGRAGGGACMELLDVEAMMGRFYPKAAMAIATPSNCDSRPRRREASRSQAPVRR
jgi:hypothetical protein